MSPKRRANFYYSPILSLRTFTQCSAQCEQLSPGWKSKRDLQWHRNLEARLKSTTEYQLHGAWIPSPAERKNLSHLKIFETSGKSKLKLQPNLNLA